MKLAGLALVVPFTLVAAVACAPVEAAVQLPAVSTPLPNDPTLLPASGTAGPGGCAICDCPWPVAATPAPGVARPPLIICSCPFLPAPPTDIGPTPQPLTGETITMADNGRMFLMVPGEHCLLDLGMDAFQWSVSIDNPNVFSRIPSLLLIRGAQGIYEARNPGQATLRATGDPPCRNLKPICMAPSLIFRITVIVR